MVNKNNSKEREKELWEPVHARIKTQWEKA